MIPGSDWSTQQLGEFLGFVSQCGDENEAVHAAVERITEAVEAEVAVISLDGEIVASTGFGMAGVPEEVAREIRAGDDLSWPIGTSWTSLRTPVEGWDGAVIHLRRSGEDGFRAEERNLVRGMGRVLGLTRVMLERQRLLDRLVRIQRSISHRAPLQEVLDAITLGAQELLGDEVASMRLIDPADARFCDVVSLTGVPSELEPIRRTEVGQGAGGRAISEQRLVVMEGYAEDPDAIPFFVDHQVTAAIAAPVYEEGVVVGSLVVASHRPGRRYSESEREGLVALADNASVALMDAKTLETMRAAQRAKDMFLAMVSHELRTPLTVMMAALRTVEVGMEVMTHDDMREMLTSGYRRGTDLERLIDRLLRGASAELLREDEVATIGPLIQDAVEASVQPARIRVGTVTEGSYVIEATSLREIVGILLENALSHSVKDSLVLLDAVVGDDELSLTVTNPGSLPEDIPAKDLFEPFQRGADATSPGVGLGLYIAAQVAESAGGSLHASSADGFVCFELRLPVREERGEETTDTRSVPALA
jgi:signal transduction histidine kinase